jgi:basic amino acid/polyamine antiporter, APA family
VPWVAPEHDPRPIPEQRTTGGTAHPALTRRLGTADAVTVGLGAMLGAGVFVAFGPAAAAAGSALAASLVLAGLVAWANADSSARLAAVLPTSGGAYTYGRSRLSPAWGVVAGFAFLLGKTISAGAIAWAVGTYLWPEQARALAVAAVVLLTVLASAGVQRSAAVTRVVVGVVLVTLTALVLATAVRPGTPSPGGGAGEPTVLGVLQGAGILFFAFAGYARIATLGEEVRRPERTLPRAIAIALGVVLLTYAAVGWAVVSALGTKRLAASTRPVADAVAALGGAGWVPVVGAVAAAAALASALGVLLGLSRTTLAMARDCVLPGALAHLDGPDGDRRPVRAQLAVGAGVVVGLLLLDLPRAIALSSALVLVYYGVAHLAALTLPGGARRVVPALGLLGCGTVAVALVLRAVGAAG